MESCSSRTDRSSAGAPWGFREALSRVRPSRVRRLATRCRSGARLPGDDRAESRARRDRRAAVQRRQARAVCRPAARPVARHPAGALGAHRCDLQGMARHGRGGGDRGPGARPPAREGCGRTHDPQRRGVLQPISHVGDMVPVITGVALTFKLRGEQRVALTWVGDGSTKTAAAHEGTNLAAVQRVPAIFIIQNNQVALGTRLDQHHLPGSFTDWPASYGIWGAEFDGNNVLDAYAATRLAAERCRAGNGPAMLVAQTFRMGGHATHDEREARDTIPGELFQLWGKRDPIGLYEEYLKEDGVVAERLAGVEAAVTAQVEQAADAALQSRERMPPGESALDGVYARNGGR